MLLISFGTRPEWIKIKPVVDKIAGHLDFKLLCTNQHLDIIDKSVSRYKVDYLDILPETNNRLDSIIINIMKHADKIFNNISSVMVQGDTTSALAIALAAFHRNIKIIHLEAGLRSWDKNNPYPEEFNRISIGAMADIHLCPTEECQNNLRKIKSTSSESFVVGNTVLDNLVNIEPTLSNIIFITMHRRENIAIIDKWFKAINNLAISHPELNFIFPMHPNPSIRKYKDILTNVKVIDPLSHKECVNYISKCGLVITDSGGLQEESAFLKKKCIVCRKTTERTEGEHVFSELCYEPEMLGAIFDISKRELINKPCPYGDGKSSYKILEILKKL